MLLTCVYQHTMGYDSFQVFQVHRYHPTACLCRKVLARYIRIKMTEKSEFAPWLSGYLDATFCSITAGGWFYLIHWQHFPIIIQICALSVLPASYFAIEYLG